MSLSFSMLVRCTELIALMALMHLATTGRVSAGDRTTDGTYNNLANPDWGAASDVVVGRNVQLRRMAAPAYEDGIATPAGSSRPSARVISNTVSAQSDSVLNDRHLTDFVWQWGQFVDHDIDLTEGVYPSEPFNIEVPPADPYFDPFSTGNQVITLNRSAYDPATGIIMPRQQINQITSYIDASNIYGSDEVRAAALRTGTNGRLKTSAGNLLPFNLAGLPNANGGPLSGDELFLAGDVRANEQIGLTAMHTLFVREHNRLTSELAAANPDWNDDDLYQRARKIVGAQMQIITYNEFLPALLGPYAPSLNANYDPQIDATISNEFSTAAYRLGHSMLSSSLRRVDNTGSTPPAGNIALRDAFFNPTLLSSSEDLDLLLKGLASQWMQEVDTLVFDDVCNFLFGAPGAGGFDLTALNIQRGRDHGLADYNTTRVTYGLSPARSFADVTTDPVLQAALQSLYGSPDEMDVWVGALAEDHLPNASAGELITASLVEQFTRLRDGDRFWCQIDPDFSQKEFSHLKNTTLAEIIMRNTGITNIQTNVFVLHGKGRTNFLHVDDVARFQSTVAAVPEPSAVVLFGIGTIALFGPMGLRRRAMGES